MSLSFCFTNRFLVSTFILFCFMLSSSAFSANTGGFSLGSTRVIYDAGKNQATISVINSAKGAPFLAQSWVDMYQPAAGKDTKISHVKAPFMVTPPLYRQDEGKNTLRIVRTGGNIPSDRESVFWLNVKAIPGTPKSLQGKNSVQFAYVLRVKMFYRPTGLQSKPSSAYQELKFARQNNQLVISNPTPYYVTFSSLNIGGKEVSDTTAMVPPLGTSQYDIPHGVSGNKVSFKALNDFGGLYPERTVNF